MLIFKNCIARNHSIKLILFSSTYTNVDLAPAPAYLVTNEPTGTQGSFQLEYDFDNSGHALDLQEEPMTSFDAQEQLFESPMEFAQAEVSFEEKDSLPSALSESNASAAEVSLSGELLPLKIGPAKLIQQKSPWIPLAPNENLKKRSSCLSKNYTKSTKDKKDQLSANLVELTTIIKNSCKPEHEKAVPQVPSTLPGVSFEDQQFGNIVAAEISKIKNEEKKTI